MSFASDARRNAVTWKNSTHTLPSKAVQDAYYSGNGMGPYPFCLPAEYASYNLLPEARFAIERFASANIAWHASTDRGPSNHLLSSQVQCVNALAPMVADADALRWFFGHALDIVELRAIGGSEGPEDLVTFEWLPPHDLLNEWGGKLGKRGALNTSVDAAISFRTSEGATELTLVEWKYRERYAMKYEPDRDAARVGRYSSLVTSPHGPMRSAFTDLPRLFVEPVYQLMRLQLLAAELEHAKFADVVRVVVCAPRANKEYWSCVPDPLVGACSWKWDPQPTDLATMWRQFLKQPDRFKVLDTARLVRPDAPTSAEFRSRYRHMALTC